MANKYISPFALKWMTKGFLEDCYGLYSQQIVEIWSTQGNFHLKILELKNIIIVHSFILFGKWSLDNIFFLWHVIGKIEIFLQIFCWNFQEIYLVFQIHDFFVSSRLRSRSNEFIYQLSHSHYWAMLFINVL